MSSPSIVLLIPYFGKWPVWFSFFLMSCRYNRSIQWVFYTDCGIPENVPENVFFNETTFSGYKNYVSDKLKINFNPESPYKLCDLKPALGYIHEKDIKGYDFWGFSDIDLVYGDLRSYFSLERLMRYDLLSTHARRISGHFCLMRNTKKMRESFKLIKNWQELLADNTHHALDEGAYSRIFIRHKNFPTWLSGFLSRFNSWRTASEFSEAFTTPNGRVQWIDNSYKFPTEWRWSKGRLINNLTGSKEFPYFHFIAWKNEFYKFEACTDQSELNSKCLVITKEGFALEDF